MNIKYKTEVYIGHDCKGKFFDCKLVSDRMNLIGYINRIHEENILNIVLDNIDIDTLYTLKSKVDKEFEKKKTIIVILMKLYYSINIVSLK